MRYYTNAVTSEEQISNGDWPITEFDPDTDRCRPEHAEHTNILEIIKRYGPPTLAASYIPLSSPSTIPVHDFDLDFQSSQNLLLEASEAFNSASGAVQKVVGGLNGLLDLLASGGAFLRDGEIFVAASASPQSGDAEAGTGQGEAAAGGSVI